MLAGGWCSVTIDAEGTGGADLQRKLDLLNGTLDAERAEQARRQMQYIAHSGYSEDSDYTSDLNYPVGQHANCSASQFRSAAHQMHTPQEVFKILTDTSAGIDTWSQLHAQVSVESAISWRTAADWQSGEEQRRPSLERQNTLYDDNMYGFESYSGITHTRLRIVGDDSRQWDSGGQYFYDDGHGLTPTEYENIVNKRRSSVVQLPQVPPKAMVPSSRYSDYNEMAPYRPRPRRTAASLPATPSSTPKRGRALPVPPGSESGSTRGSRGRRLPQPPTPMSSSMTSYGSFSRPRRAPSASTLTHVPYVPEPERTIPDASYGYDSFGFQQQDFQDTATASYPEPSYNNTTYDSDGMQPFFDETPHATPPAAAQKTPWTETETIPQFTYPITSESDTLLPKTVPSTVSSYLPQPPVTSQQDTYQTQTAAAVAAPAVTQPPHTTPATTAPTSQFSSSVAPVTPYTSTAPVTSSVLSSSPPYPSSDMSTSVQSSSVNISSTVPVSLPRTPSLRRQESIQRPSVRRTRTLPDAPEDLAQSSFDESAYEDEYHKTEYDQSIDRDRTSLDRYRDDDYAHDTILEEVPEERRLSDVPPSPSLQKQASPTRTVAQIRKPSVDSYHSQTPSIVDRRTSQSSFHPEEKLAVPTTQEVTTTKHNSTESLTDKSKVTFQDERTTYHEVPEETDGFQEAEPYDDQVEEYRDDVSYTDKNETFIEERDKFDRPEHFQETDDTYPQSTDSGFREKQERAEEQPEQPKLTPRQRWHRAYNKIVMQLNV
ncbi:hypothetical protein SFRURICE_018066 [Spodoptera frugiperda]|nr:hypothetical protein SFRURICE_018066 [Spodoptera frugiperda]